MPSKAKENDGLRYCFTVHAELGPSPDVPRQGGTACGCKEVRRRRAHDQPPRTRHAAFHLSGPECLRLRQGRSGLALGGKPRPSTKTTNELRERIRKTVAFADGVTDALYASANERKVRLSWAPGKVIFGKDYLLQMTIPNTYFHIAMAYAILRHNGVAVGKQDFLGPINLVEG
jgi:hypothetical protein